MEQVWVHVIDVESHQEGSQNIAADREKIHESSRWGQIATR
jgi:hypothetical protein